MARHIDKLTIKTPALEILDDALMDVASGLHPRLIFSMAPQEGKSERVSRFFPTWMLLHNPELRIASISAGDMLARRWGKKVRNDIYMHRDLGLTIKRDSQASNEWELEGHKGGMITSSIGGVLTGRPVDLMLIDDPHKDQKEADSELMRANVQEWWRSVGSTRLPPGGRVVLIMTRWHSEDLAGWLPTLDVPGQRGWRLINLPAQADHKPEEGETDILGREPGEYMISARGRDLENWLERRRDAGPRAWTALYQGRPAPAEGGIFKREWWQHYRFPRAVELADGTMYALGADQVIQSWDMAFKDTSQSDYVVGQVWARRGSQVWLLDQVHARMDFPTTCDAVEELTAKWPQATAKVIEDKANGPAVIAQLRTRIGGLIAYTPLGSKEARAHAVSPFVAAGDVHLPDKLNHPWIIGFIDEHAGFPNGAHDDRVDACTQALNHMLLSGTSADEFMRALAAGASGAGTPATEDTPDIDFQGMLNTYRQADLPAGIARPTMGAHNVRGGNGEAEDA